MFKITYAYTCIATTYHMIETFSNADEMREWYENSGLEDMFERGRLDYIHFYHAGVEFSPAFLWII